MAGEGGQEMPGVEPGGVQQAQGTSPIPGWMDNFYK